jgi:hypothetical protein
MSNEIDEVNEIIAKCELGSTPELVKRLRYLLLAPPLRQRIGQSATAIDLKIRRLTDPTASVGLRVLDRWSDLLGWIHPERTAP